MGDFGQVGEVKLKVRGILLGEQYKVGGTSFLVILRERLLLMEEILMKMLLIMMAVVGGVIG